MSLSLERTIDRHLVEFVETLRKKGISISLGSTLEFGRALAETGINRRESVYWSGRATLAIQPEDIEIYDQVFDQHWNRETPQLEEVPDLNPLTLLFDEPSELPEAEEEPTGITEEAINVRYSRTEILAGKDFAKCTEEELEELYKVMRQLRLHGQNKRSRRLKTSRNGRYLDLRRTMKAALRIGGDPIQLFFQNPGERPRRLVLLLDVSGSMETYARSLIRFVHAAIAGRNQVEAFTLGTRLTRLTRELSSRDPDVALSRAAQTVPDWSGGTRLGEGLRLFNDEWGIRGMARGATVVILSDGWDRGETEILEEQMERLSRVSHQIVWVNPLKATPGYEPLAKGMSAALPYIDHFLAGHNLVSLQTLTKVISE